MNLHKTGEERPLAVHPVAPVMAFSQLNGWGTSCLRPTSFEAPWRFERPRILAQPAPAGAGHRLGWQEGAFDGPLERAFGVEPPIVPAAGRPYG